MLFGLLGFALTFAASLAGMFALLLAAVAVGGHLLATRDTGAARVISFDPSSVATLAPFPAAVSLTLFVAFVVIAVAPRRADHRRRTSSVRPSR